MILACNVYDIIVNQTPRSQHVVSDVMSVIFTFYIKDWTGLWPINV